MAIPIVEELFGRETLGVLFVFNVGCEAAIWTVGIVMLAGVSLKAGGWRRALNPPVYALALAVLFNLGGGGRKSRQLVGLREISGSIDVEYTDAVFRDAVLNDTPMSLLPQFTGGALSTGVETLQLVLPEVKFDNALPTSNGADLSVPSLNFAVLDNLTAAQPLWVVQRTADTAL